VHIVQVDIDNFKSFSRKTKIPFYEGFTVISGPNGSGKSNIVDSILFVLSLSSARSLRAEKLTDLINNVSGKHTAEVTLTFSDETKIRRRIKRTSSGYYSYYYLNEKLCTQTDVLAYLSKYGIKPHGYNVVMQGDVTRIMEMSDLDRRRMIDEIAGVAEFDAKKEQALTELEQVRARIEREELLLADLAIRLEELREAREGAVKYQKLQTELDYFRAARMAAQLRGMERELTTIAHAKSEQETELGRIREDISLETHERDCRMEDVRETDRQISEKSGPEYIKLLADLEAERGNIRVAEQTIGRLRKEKEGNLASMNNIFVDMKRFQNSIDDKNRESRQLQIDRANLAMEAETQKKILDKAEELVRRKSQDSEGAQSELLDLMNRIEEKKSERSAILSERDGIIERSRIRSQESERVRRQQTVLAQERAAKQEETAKIEAALSGKQSEKSVFDRQIGEADRAMMACRKSLDPVQEEIRSLTQKQMRLEAQQSVSAETNRAISAVLGMDGIFGTVASLGKVPSEYTTALNIAAGGRLQNVIADTDQTASDAIRYLKEGRLGRVTFLPLNKIRAPAPLPPLAGNGVVDYAINLIEFDETYRTAFSLVFGQTVVVETLEAGRRLMGRFRMVTLEGELLEKTGAMTGGSVRKDVRGFGAAVDKEAAAISARLSGLKSEEADLQAAEARHRAVADGLRAEKSIIDADITKLELTLAELSRRLDAIADEEVGLAAVLSSMEHDAAGVSAKVAGLEEKQDALTGTIAELNSRIGAIRQLLDESEFTLLTEQLQKAKRDADDIRRRLETKEADLADVNRERQYFRKRLEDMTAEKDAVAAKNVKIDEEIAVCNHQIELAGSAIASLEEKQKSFTGELESLRNERSALQEKVDASQQRLAGLSAAVERCNVQIQALDEKASSVSAEIDAIRGDITEVDCSLSVEEIEEGIATTERAIRKLGAVNMLAIEQYDENLAKSEERTARKDVLSREREALLERIESFARMKFDAFMAAYIAINENFQKIFARLTMGSGHLVLDNEEDPFLGGMTFEVHPRDKEVHRLNMMSGGEKSLTTLSFIFAIQSYMPAPFYAFDEVDMSLDGANVERIAQMVRELCESSQFVIVSLRKPMIEAADRIMGVTIRPDKSTLVTGVKLNV
jgi:chromosome segregation protein